MSAIRHTKLETDFPFEEVSEAASAEKTLRFGHPSTLMQWRGRMPISVVEAIIRAAEIEKTCAVLDPFAGSGMTGVGSARQGHAAYLADVNPVAFHLCNAAMGFATSYYGRHIAEQVLQAADEVERVARHRLREVYGETDGIIAWLWVRTVKSPDPRHRSSEVPLVSNFVLSKKNGIYLKPVVDGGKWRFEICRGELPENAEYGLRFRRGGEFRCLFSGTPITREYIRESMLRHEDGLRLVAVVENGPKERRYRPATAEEEARAKRAQPKAKPMQKIRGDGDAGKTLAGWGLEYWGDLFTDRQALWLETLIDAILELPGTEPDLVAALTLAVVRAANRNSVLCPWEPRVGIECVHASFVHYKLNMRLDFAETVPDFREDARWIAAALEACTPKREVRSKVAFGDVRSLAVPRRRGMVITEPPAVGSPNLCDVTDFAYVWLRQALKNLYPQVFATLIAPRMEAVTDNAQLAESLGKTLQYQDRKVPGAFCYSLSPVDRRGGSVMDMPDLKAFLASVLKAGWKITATWPLSTDRASFAKGVVTDVVVAVRKRDAEEEVISRGEYRSTAAESAKQAVAGRDFRSDLQWQIVAFGGALKALAGLKGVMTAGGEMAEERIVLIDTYDAINDLKENENESMA